MLSEQCSATSASRGGMSCSWCRQRFGSSVGGSPAPDARAPTLLQKALLRRASAHEQLLEYKLALADASTALAIENMASGGRNPARLASCQAYIRKYTHMLRLQDKKGVVVCVAGSIYSLLTG